MRAATLPQLVAARNRAGTPQVTYWHHVGHTGLDLSGYAAFIPARRIAAAPPNYRARRRARLLREHDKETDPLERSKLLYASTLTDWQWAWFKAVHEVPIRTPDGYWYVQAEFTEHIQLFPIYSRNVPAMLTEPPRRQRRNARYGVCVAGIVAVDGGLRYPPGYDTALSLKLAVELNTGAQVGHQRMWSRSFNGGTYHDGNIPYPEPPRETWWKPPVRDLS